MELVGYLYDQKVVRNCIKHPQYNYEKSTVTFWAVSVFFVCFKKNKFLFFRFTKVLVSSLTTKIAE